MITFFLESAGDILATVFGLLIAVVGAIVTFVTKSRNKGKSWKEICKSILTGKNQEFEEMKKALQEKSKEISKLTSKLVEKEKEKK